MTESNGRTPHSAEPAEGDRDTTDEQDTGRTPHPEQPAEGRDPDAGDDPAAGVDPGNRVTGA